jgi:hypothetical protein
MPPERRREPESSSRSASAETSIASLASPGAMPASETLVLIVAGSTIAAEIRDRPLAYRLCERLRAWLDANEPGAATVVSAADPRPQRLEPVVCSDVWYLNTRDLAGRPAVAIGEPNSNAATALISNRLPTAFVIEGSVRVHLDPEFIDLRAALWGASAAATAAAIDVFAERYLHEFLRAAI